MTTFGHTVIDADKFLVRKDWQCVYMYAFVYVCVYVCKILDHQNNSGLKKI